MRSGCGTRRGALASGSELKSLPLSDAQERSLWTRFPSWDGQQVSEQRI
jgi:hypothetical protein